MSEQKTDQRCLACGAVMFPKVLDAEGHLAMNTTTHAALQDDGEDLYYACPACHAKNVVEVETGWKGLPALKFMRVKQ